jgi:hypothetical protein
VALSFSLGELHVCLTPQGKEVLVGLSGFDFVVFSFSGLGNTVVPIGTGRALLEKRLVGIAHFAIALPAGRPEPDLNR